LKSLQLPNYQELKNKKFSECSLFSYHFFKQFFKKEIGKENNYIFNFRDNFLNDMSNIDKSFFEDYFKFIKDKDIKHLQEQNNIINNININNENVFLQNFNIKLTEKLLEKELIYEFSIYHPLKNTKTQQISITGSSYLHDLKDKIYCVLDEIHSNNNQSFFFIENAFYNDLRIEKNKTLSSKILENKIRKLNIKTTFSSMIGNENLLNTGGGNSNRSNNNNNVINLNSLYSQQEENNNNNNNNNIDNNSQLSNSNNTNKREEYKFNYYQKSLYCKNFYRSSEIYEELSMSDMKIDDVPMRIGYPYLYRHIDNCDHMIILSDIRLADKHDKQLTDEEECMVTYQKKLKRRICDACAFYYAKFISINDPLGGVNNKVVFMCEFCLKKLHEKEIKENTLTSLKLIPYFHD
jgi:hypothetical protein